MNCYIMKWRGRCKVVNYVRSFDNIKLDLGCGMKVRPGYIGLDLLETADICWDLRWGMPFNDNSVEEIRSDHFLEHLELSLVLYVLRECHRILKPKKLLSFTIPHFDPYIEAYLNKDYNFLMKVINDIPENQDNMYNTCFDRIAWLLNRNGEHKSIYDKESIIDKVKIAGFKNVYNREYDQEQDTERRYSSIYINAIK